MAKRKSATILLSRQNLRPSLQDSWVQNLIHAVDYVKSNGWTLNSSIGTPNWDIISACASINKVPLRLFVSNNVSKESTQFLPSLNPLEIKRFSVSSVANSKSDLLEARDITVVNSSDILIPISIRTNGIMSQLLNSAEKSGRPIINNFKINYVSSKKLLAYSIDLAQISPTIRALSQKYLIHWTRSSNGPWPNESLLDFYRSILISNDYPRLAIDTLTKILRDKVILASSKNMPGKVSTVSFSSLPPIEAIKLMKWRARYRQMTFEPYGIGISADAADTFGLRKVHYYDNEIEKLPESIPKWLTQSIGKITDWRHECEYRHFGDLDLSIIPMDKFMLVCRFKSESEKLKKETGIESVQFCD